MPSAKDRLPNSMAIRLVVNCDHEGQSFIIAYDTDTGRPRWKKLRDEQTTWLTPFIVEHDGVVQVVVNGMNRARGYDLQSGDVLWECGGQAQGPVPTAVAYQGLVFCMTGHRGSAPVRHPARCPRRHHRYRQGGLVAQTATHRTSRRPSSTAICSTS